MAVQEKAKIKIRQEFKTNMLEKDPKKIELCLRTAEKNLTFLKQNVVQGVLKKDAKTYGNPFSISFFFVLTTSFSFV